MRIPEPESKPVAEGGLGRPCPHGENFCMGPKIVRRALRNRGDFGGLSPPHGDLPATGLPESDGTQIVCEGTARLSTTLLGRATCDSVEAGREEAASKEKQRELTLARANAVDHLLH